MKLKKIVSLALASLMAVSMLAGCGDNGSSNGNGTIVEPGNTTSAVAIFNDTQSELNDVKVVFSSSSSLDDALQKAVKATPTGDANDIARFMFSTIGVRVGDAADVANSVNALEPQNGDSKELLFVYMVNTGVFNEDSAVQFVAKDLDGMIAELDENDYDAGETKDSYLAYSYTGTVSVVTSETAGNADVYYVAYTITKTATKTATVEK